MELHGMEIDEQAIAARCQGAGVVRAYLIGSILTPRFSRESDIDLLIETDPARPAGLLALGGLASDLSDLLGRPVHLTLLTGIPADERSRVLAAAMPIAA
jgi:uncharacterized protein